MDEKTLNGKWKIIKMDTWDVEPGWYIEFDGQGNGALHFLYVDVELDCRIDDTRSPNRVDFSFHGSDECDETYGRGWAEINGKNLVGHVVFHKGDESGFKAKRKSGAT